MSARERFQENKDLVTGYNDLIDSARMTAAMDAALITFVEKFSTSNTVEEAAANAWRLEGAQKFLLYLKTLNTGTATTKPVSTALKHNV